MIEQVKQTMSINANDIKFPDNNSVKQRTEKELNLNPSEEYDPSEEGMDLLQEKRDAMAEYLAKLDEAADPDSELDDQADSTMKALKIASNIMRGLKVPPKDEKFLIDYNPSLYQAAKSCAALSKEHGKAKSVLGEEENNDQMKVEEQNNAKSENISSPPLADVAVATDEEES